MTDYLELEQVIIASDKQEMLFKWKLGKMLLKELRERYVKRFTAKRLGEIAKESGVNKRELNYCRRFAERYPAPSMRDGAIAEYKAWDELIRFALR